MTSISFDITYKKATDIDSIKLSSDADFQQLKIMICGRYKIYDINKVYIYYKDKIITSENNTKLKNIFKQKRALIEVKETPSGESEEISKYFCQCNNPATYICDICNEYICNFCFNLKKHITHKNKIIELQNYNNYIKISLRDNENLINKQIIKDDGYLFLEYLEYDINNEIKTINSMYDYAKNQLEEIKKFQINFISEFSKCNKYNDLSEKIEEVVSQYSNINMDNEDFDNLIEEKNDIIRKTKELLSYYDEIKMHLLYYTKNIKEIQNFNESLISEIKENFNITKKKFNQMPKIFFKQKMENSLTYSNKREKKEPQELINSPGLNDISKNLNSDFPISDREKVEKTEVDITPKREKDVEKKNISNIKKTKKKDKKVEIIKNMKVVNKDRDSESPSISNEKKNKTKKIIESKKKLNPDRVLIKLKDDTKFLIFSIDNLSFKERYFIDRSNFVKEIITINDIIQLNHNNILYMLMGKNSNK